jgi:hypothetical protein
MKMYKLTLLILSVISQVSWAGMMLSQCQNESVTTPCEQYYMEWGGHAVYIEPSSSIYSPISHSNLNQASQLNLGTSLPWSWGFQVEMAYDYHTGNDLNMNWYHYRSATSDTLAAPVSLNNIVMSSSSNTNPTHFDNITVTTAGVNVHPQWDQVNIEFAKRIHLGATDDVRLHGGVNYSRVSSSGNWSWQGSTLLDGTLTYYQNTEVLNTEYSGFGVRSGMDLSHDFNNGLGLYAHGALSILAGMSKSSEESNDYINNVLYSGRRDHNRPCVVPEVDGRIGANYTYEFIHGDLHADVGWLWVNYFNALSSENYSLGFQGLFLGLKWVGHLI